MNNILSKFASIYSTREMVDAYMYENHLTKGVLFYLTLSV